ncbi:MAG: cadherin-like beta sandwich domain-containing protein [Lachnospiraceae bacterium]|nr:cadherin-like beta sandwich domain-containing protein [Lachnospiraceae bacterium]
MKTISRYLIIFLFVAALSAGLFFAPVAKAEPDQSFETALEAEKFPESYRVYLRTLHASYPNWIFKAVHTGLDWNTVLENEKNKAGKIKNTIQGSSSLPHYNWRSTDIGYDWATDKWTAYDGKTFFAASDQLIAYYMDPRSCLDASYIFQFETLSYVEGGQTAKGVDALLSGTFMGGKNIPGTETSYSAAIMEAGKSSGVSPYHLASRIRVEIGTKRGVAVSGTHETYPGIYNFYNIGAKDSATGNAVTNGLKWAATKGSYKRPWNTEMKALSGGASYIGSAYISRGQDTLYFEKFNTVNSKDGLYAHQYQTAVQAPSVEGKKIGESYKTAGMKDGAITFRIPVYTNMPAERCPKPADSGSPNNWLKSLEVKGYTLSPAFGVNVLSEYSVTVPADLKELNILATTVNSSASIKGKGKVALADGKNELKIKVTAQNGNVREYKLTVLRSNEKAKQETKTETTETAATGTLLYGDLNGDGKVNALDLLKLQKHLLGKSLLKGDYLKAANLKQKGDTITALDLLKLQKIIIGG